MFWPTEAQRQAAIFENEYARLQEDFARIGKVAPSRETVVETARRDPRRSPYQIVVAMRVRLDTAV